MHSFRHIHTHARTHAHTHTHTHTHTHRQRETVGGADADEDVALYSRYRITPSTPSKPWPPFLSNFTITRCFACSIISSWRSGIFLYVSHFGQFQPDGDLSTSVVLADRSGPFFFFKFQSLSLTVGIGTIFPF